ncbi:2-desacetyl-2-hydroxyethyl bacteriochlorophyllide A dehydrogenase [Parabacteroides sp. PF5-5]|uniref:zinc-binding alcohol dehydrogenase family protein n=1 Tax=unclassified Parabacteroides TaxID=2649774 RepID=UPI0024754F50|nr:MULTISPECIES: zinc-binding alcohol dehydrogenase family protein [unclassified Parabacteroides]MDH6304849.1 2-desacetyl-2-hydroxyethyl bacteriochlorophyllide A dehydrogenase [Parabacteroides sp. PH5-39]MDH6316065.1 2-desacetyl-2-hydroxyethyl bacteriochlorophyllide A dehydrogenase [Parabacteroides sp. PF5-13]MDH6319722.1 2-desacetyl-2-hydroxyethyl bacteriochlorophyllide A dehydrogenase [Parabacteroides sp. PH5-13]MDH6323453.1 2-desacetyl-2-hydroxyethyl bacteriochlorophyllide A dehydrogenase [P
MKAIQIIGQRKTQLIEIPKPELKPGHVLLKIGFVGFCGSDLNTFRGLNPLVKLPIIPGHEIGAVIEAVADDVPSGLQPGMHATVNPYTSCGHCPSCRKGRFNACEFNQTLGVQRDGAMSEYILVPWQKVIADEGISLRDLALVEPMSVGFHAVSRAELTDIDTVLVLGCGMIGVGAIIRASLRGAVVIAVDVDDKKLELAKRLGAQYTINSTKEDLHERIREITREEGADVVIEAVGRPETYTASISEVAFAGRVVYIGYAKEKILFDTSHFVKKELGIRGSRNATPTDFKAVMEYLKCGTCPVDELITAIYAPEEAQTALEKWSANPGEVFRILIRF